MPEANRSHTRFQVKENDADSPGTSFTGEIISPKRRLSFRSFAEILSLKRLRKDPLSSQGLTNMVRKFEATETLGIQPGRRRKCVVAHIVDYVATQVKEDRS
ncbi:hypothetical protein TNCV_266881 [Trichonephila clavipes]|nr:hypothetical protein TNCV_266881 [Trichonephila clavipes]